ncbi:MAG: aldehyde dehydrogenase family protein, partial [Candidatus Latescibacterota bacterium]|nr:aldehyde dehydrogenase family protein [Candidatus Latescibacterota bacterium]
MKMHIGGEWTDRDDKLEVMNPFDGSIIDTVPKASATDVAQAVETAEAGAAIMSDMPAYERYQILHRAAEIMEQRLDDLGQTITKEEGKILPEGLGEAARSLETLTLSAEEAKRLTGETLGLDGASNGAGKFGFTLRIPVGVVAAI